MSLYNIERPKTFDQVLGQNNVMAMIKAILASENIPNVSLFVGAHGCGKTTVARLFAKAINCQHPSENGPCNSCAACQEVNGDNSLDVLELDGASNNKVEDVHAIIEGAKYAPLGKYKVYIIDEVHMLSIAAFNALLKLLEEPPKHCIFILCTTEEHKIPATIISRARRFYFERIDLDVICSALHDICVKYDVPFDNDALRIIAKASEGCMRDALSILEVFLDEKDVSKENVIETLGVAQDEAVFGVLAAVLSGNSAEAISQFRTQVKRGKDLKVMSRAFLDSLTDAACYLATNDLSLITGTDSYLNSLKAFCSKVNPNRIMELLNGFTDIYAAVSRSGNDSALEARIIALIDYQSETIAEISLLKERLEMLENALFDGAKISNVSSILPDNNAEDNCTANTSVDMQSTPAGLEEPEAQMPTSEKDLPDTASFNMDVLPGDIYLPEGTQVLGTIDINSDSALESIVPVSDETVSTENAPETANDSFDLFSEMFSVCARQGR